MKRHLPGAGFCASTYGIPPNLLAVEDNTGFGGRRSSNLSIRRPRRGIAETRVDRNIAQGRTFSTTRLIASATGGGRRKRSCSSSGRRVFGGLTSILFSESRPTTIDVPERAELVCTLRGREESFQLFGGQFSELAAR